MLRKAIAAVFAILGLAAVPVSAEPQEEVAASDLKRLSIEELMQIEVTSASRRTERFSRAAAAITVITAEEIRRSGANSLPEALRLANPLHVARSTQGDYAISARGFNTTTANKMLVLIDGRSIYTPLFSGVFWDVQDVLLEDVERIEVIRGPGATLWGANAVNGIVNIITRRAEDTQDGLAIAGGGTEEKAFGAVRYGGRLGERGYYRTYGKYLERDALVTVTGQDARNPRDFGQGGFRTDLKTSDTDTLTLQGDAYTGQTRDPLRDLINLDGGNLLGRWSRHLADGSDLSLQVYWDRTHRHIFNLFEEHRDTVDLDFDRRIRLLESRHEVVWGFGYRHTRDRVGNSTVIGFLPDRRGQDLFSLFAQDEVRLLGDRLRVTVGAKLEHNDSTGLEVQPNIRAAWSPNDRRMLWGAVSRAVRTPTRFDEDLFFSTATGIPLFVGSRDFDSEELLAYELGYRVQLQTDLTLDVAAFYNVYDDLRSQEPPAAGGFPVTFGNNLEADTWGAEIRGNYQPFSWWRMYISYAYFDRDFRFDPESRDLTGGLGEGNDPQNRAMLRSNFDLPGGVELDGWLRYVDELPFPAVPSYLELDLRVGWRPIPALELSLVGQNLLDEAHAEFGPATPTRQEVERGFYGKVTWQF
ncbi:MAG TPA: TonB-dependent receptor [Thermoanaerobaculia bacterium]